MNKKNSVIISTFISATLAFGIGCQTAPKAGNANVNSTNTNAASRAANTTSAPASNSPVGSLATPTDAYKTAHQLRAARNIEGLKQVMAPDMIEFLTMIGEEENKSLDEMLREMFQKPQADRAETRNERISGDSASVEYLTETGGWKTMDFQKIDGKWKIGFPKADMAYEDSSENL